MSSFDVWIVRFEPGDRPPAERLQSAFGIDAPSARAFEQSVPKIIKHSLDSQAASELREALEAIGAVVECRPVRPPKPRAAAEGAVVFHPPGADLLPTGGASVPPVRLPSAGAPRATGGDANASSSDARETPPTSTSPLADSPELQRRKSLRRSVAVFLAGAAIIAMNWFLGGSVLRGEANWVGVGFDGLGIYFLGLGAHGLVTKLRS